MPADPSGSRAALRAALKLSVSALTAASVPFALAGSYALWAHGGPEPDHDVDLVVAEDAVEAAAAALAGAGFVVDRPPEGWLFKAVLDGASVDVLHREAGRPVDAAGLADVPQHQLFGVWGPVLPATRVVTTKLRSLDEHLCDFAALLPAVRAVREQLDWTRIAADTADNDYAFAFLVLARRLGIAPSTEGA